MREGGWIRGGGIDCGRKLDESHYSPHYLLLQVMNGPLKAGAEKGRELMRPSTAAPNPSQRSLPSTGNWGRQVDGPHHSPFVLSCR